MKSIFQAVDSANKDGIAIEALVMAETQFLSDDYPKEENDDDSAMAYKDDDGYWCITGSHRKFNSFEDLEKAFPNV